MKKLFLTAAVGVICAFGAVAALQPFYQTLSANGNAATPAETDFLSQPGLQARLISASYSSDTNGGQLQVSTGGTAFAITATNAATTTTTNQINSTNGLNGSSVLFLEHGGTAYVATMASYGNTGTNVLNGGTITNVNYVVTAAGGFGVLPAIGDSVYQMGSATTIPVGAATNWINGEAIFIGNVGRPMRVVLTPALVTNKLNAVTARYE